MQQSGVDMNTEKLLVRFERGRTSADAGWGTTLSELERRGA